MYLDSISKTLPTFEQNLIPKLTKREERLH
jgi:hypothetical protein